MLSKFDLYDYKQKSEEDLLQYFDSLNAVRKGELKGFWKGVGIETGHPINNILTHCDWYGKRFLPNDEVDSFIFKQRESSKYYFKIKPRCFAFMLRAWKFISPKYSMNIFGLFFETKDPSAQLTEITYRDQKSAAIFYDNVKFNSYFRRIDNDTILGAFETPHYNNPFFFLLEKDSNYKAIKIRKSSRSKYDK